LRSALILTVALTVMLAACGVLPFQQTAPAAQLPAQVDFTAATRTPFQPQPPTPVVTRSPRLTPLATPSPAISPSPTSGGTPLAALYPLPPTNANVTNILVLGSDQRPYDGGFRTDAILFVSIHPQTSSVRVVSVPRDLWVWIPNWGYNRINTAFGVGGFPALAQTFEVNFGVRPDYYLMVNFQGFIDIVNTLGGIDVHAEKGLRDACALPQQLGDGTCRIEPGVITMDGDTALWYVRARYTTSDFDRTRREQEVLFALFRAMMRLDAVRRAPELFAIYSHNVDTDLTLNTILPLAQIAPALVEGKNIQRYAVGPGEVYDMFIPESGAMVLQPIPDAVRAVFQQAVAEP